LPRRHASPCSVDKVSAHANQGEDRYRVFVSLYALRSASSKNELRALRLVIAHWSTDSATGHDSPWSDPTASSFPVRIPSLSSPGPLLCFAHCGLGPRACPRSSAVLRQALRWGKHGAVGCRDRDWRKKALCRAIRFKRSGLDLGIPFRWIISRAFLRGCGV
jgi:hypothetical protein